VSLQAPPPTSNNASATPRATTRKIRLVIASARQSTGHAGGAPPGKQPKDRAIAADV
jgi:hypothetical protein